MATDHIFRDRVARQVGSMLCADPVINEMDVKQIAAMHVFKHDVLAAFHRVYQTVPPKFADHLIGRFIDALPAILKDEDNINPKE